MTTAGSAVPDGTETPAGRRASVLSAAMGVFARFGYRKASMDEVARAARISRPGLYFMFGSKQELFRAAVTSALDRDLAAVESLLADSGRPLAARVVDAFDRWAGQYTGPMTTDIASLVDDDPDLLGPVVTDQPQRFADLITAALTTEVADDEGGVARQVVDTLLSTSTGIKHRASTRADYLDRLTTAVDLLLVALEHGSAAPPNSPRS